ncbi:TPA: UbiX family flavin prenyltransferase [Candidatus Bathyarchaeota archaeon]|nr:UbiX family flavin prenyltransferase [Candidatus Bathyarchaeota archaeon]
MGNVQRLIIGISGASGTIYGLRLLETLHKLRVETHLVMTKTAEEVAKIENRVSIGEVKRLATYCYNINDLTAPIASGDFQSEGMVIAPCSMKTLAGVANGYSQNLLLRAADVTLKEGRRLVLVPREAPLNSIHLENMLKLARIGVTILPAMPAFYHKPKSIDDLVNHIVGKILDVFGIAHQLYKRWGVEKL